MRNDIVHIGADKLSYEIRGIISIAELIEKQGKKIICENIGDPVQKGHVLPSWIKNIIKEHLEHDHSYAYCHTKGVYETRAFLADQNNKKGGAQISTEDILFFNGLGDAISTFYQYLKRESRVIGPSPAYSTHSSAEGAHAGLSHITYTLDPYNNWQPDLKELRDKVRYNDGISGILILNPDNPTGAVFPKETLIEIINIAKEYDLFIIADEIYQQIVFGEIKYYSIAELIGDRPAISMKGISKELPWPGSRCGWLEFYNTEKDENFKRFVKSLNDAKMLEVCSTTLPQLTIPKIMKDPRYEKYQIERREFFEKRAKESFNIFSKIKGIKVNETKGAFYFVIIFDKDKISKNRKINIESKILDIIKPKLIGVSFDKAFVIYLLAKTGICTVPLSGFNTDLQGFRMTLLEKDDKQFTHICHSITETLVEFLE